MKKKALFFSLPGLVILFFITGIRAQVTISYIQPPPNQWRAEDMWNAMITNTSDEPQIVYLYGTLDEASDGRIAEGTSSSFTVNRLYSGPLSISQLSPVHQKYVAGKYEDIVRRTGTMPGGVYHICLYVKDAKTDVVMSQDCIDQSINPASPPELIYPANGDSVKETMPVFLWMPPMPMPIGEVITYELKIIELLDGQVPVEAMEANPAFFIQKGVRSPSFQFPLSARPLVAKKRYAWQVTATGHSYEIGKSQVWSFDYCFYPDCYCGGLLDKNIAVDYGTSQHLVWDFNHKYFYNINPPITATIHLPGFVCKGNCLPPSPEYYWQISGPAGCLGSVGTTQVISNYTFTCTGKYALYFTIKCGSTTCFSARDTINFIHDCCSDFIKTVTKQELSYHPDDGVMVLKNLVSTNPKMIQEVTATIISASSRVYYPVLSSESAVAWYLSDISSDIGTFTNNSGGSAQWYGAPEDITVKTLDLSLAFGSGPCNYGIQIPSVIKDSLKFCIRYAFTNSNCVVCDTAICYSVSRTLPVNDMASKVQINNLKWLKIEPKEENTMPVDQGVEQKMK